MYDTLLDCVKLADAEGITLNLETLNIAPTMSATPLQRHRWRRKSSG